MGPEKLSESKGIGILKRGRGLVGVGVAKWVEPDILGGGRGLVGLANWVELRRGTGATKLVAGAGMLSRGIGLLPAFMLGVKMGVAPWRVVVEVCSFFRAWHSHTQGILASF